jgi:hypothetical protein
MEGKPEQAALAVEENAVGDVEKRPDDPAAADDPDRPSLLQDVQRRRVVRADVT